MAHCGNSENQLHNWQLYNKTIHLVEHGQKYHQEIDQILRQIKMLYYEKVSRVLMENLRQEIGEEKALTEKAMKHLQIQQAFIQYFRKELGNEIQYVVRKRH
jgi:signal recognition particle GTPase